jgi:hypothetical protein
VPSCITRSQKHIKKTSKCKQLHQRLVAAGSGAVGVGPLSTAGALRGTSVSPGFGGPLINEEKKKEKKKKKKKRKKKKSRFRVRQRKKKKKRKKGKKENLSAKKKEKKEKETNGFAPDLRRFPPTQFRVHSSTLEC